jgi:site-specific DNA-methyltransferase (adenine-specific)
MATQNKSLHQWFTPAWAAQEIVEQEFGWLRAGHVVVEPSCGDGAFLCAIPRNVLAIGCEIDPAQADLARRYRGRQVLVGDFLKADLPAGRVDAVIGNPPFDARLVGGFLNKSHELLVEGGQAGFILPAYIFQTSSKVDAYAQMFSIHQQLLPRNLFPGIALPLVFAKFVKEQNRKLYGFLLYRETHEIAGLTKRWRDALSSARSTRDVWAPVIESVVDSLGGEASLDEIYRAMAPRAHRPTASENWKEKVRQVVRRPGRFICTGQGRYAVARNEEGAHA